MHKNEDSVREVVQGADAVREVVPNVLGRKWAIQNLCVDSSRCTQMLTQVMFYDFSDPVLCTKYKAHPDFDWTGVTTASTLCARAMNEHPPGGQPDPAPLVEFKTAKREWYQMGTYGLRVKSGPRALEVAMLDRIFGPSWQEEGAGGKPLTDVMKQPGEPSGPLEDLSGDELIRVRKLLPGRSLLRLGVQKLRRTV